MVRFSFCKKLLEGENALFKPTLPANAHGRLLGGFTVFDIGSFEGPMYRSLSDPDILS